MQKDKEFILLIVVIGAFTLWFCCLALAPHKPAIIPLNKSDYEVCMSQDTSKSFDEIRKNHFCSRIKCLELVGKDKCQQIFKEGE